MKTNEILKNLRIKKNKSQSEMAEIFNVSLSSYQKYERDKNSVMPSIDVLIRIANHYNVTVDYLLGREPEKNPIAMLNLAVGEKEALEMYMKLPEEVRQIIIDTMIQLGEAAKKGIENKPNVIVFKHFSVNKASAGCGYDLLNDDIWQEIEVVDTPEARSADFAVEVEGRSMEPTYNDGDIVYIILTPEVPTGKIGLFTQNGKGYIKEAGEKHLISHNPDFPDIYPEDGEITCIGRVIGVAELPE